MVTKKEKIEKYKEWLDQLETKTSDSIRNYLLLNVIPNWEEDTEIYDGKEDKAQKSVKEIREDEVANILEKFGEYYKLNINDIMEIEEIFSEEIFPFYMKEAAFRLDIYHATSIKDNKKKIQDVIKIIEKSRAARKYFEWEDGNWLSLVTGLKALVTLPQDVNNKALKFFTNKEIKSKSPGRKNLFQPLTRITKILIQPRNNISVKESLNATCDLHNNLYRFNTITYSNLRKWYYKYK